jgi:very-short-patch-repair endonuclease/predicted transcriptional regulator of viral defense system
LKGSKPEAATAGWSLFLLREGESSADLILFTLVGVKGSSRPKLDRRMAEMARQQHGVVTREQLLELGMGSHAVGDRVHRGLLQAVHRGVYVLGGSRPTVDARRMAAVLACGPSAVLSHRSAARLWDVFPYEPGRIEVSWSAAGRTKHDGILLRQARLFPDEVEELDGIPVTAIFRTIFDLAAVVSQREVERAFHETEVKQLTGRVSLPQLLRRHPGRRGAATVRSILASREPVGSSQNDFEELFVAFLDEHRLPRPRLNATISIRGRFLKPDCMWEDQRLLVELDGRAVHGTDKAFEGDRQRDRVLLAEGWRSTRVTWRQLRDEPAAIAADLREMLHGASRPPTL